MERALYGPAGFYARGEPPSRHFRTSAHVSPRFGAAWLTLLREVDAALGRPPTLDLVDIGAGRGELLGQIVTAADAEPSLAARISAVGVEVTAPPAGLDSRIRWQPRLPPRISGLVIANEWLDNIPVDVAELTADGPRQMLVDPAVGTERVGPPLAGADLAWVRAYWPLRRCGDRAEIGRSRCQAWSGVIRSLHRGMALAVDYGHDRAHRPALGTLASYQHGRQVRVIPDGSRDLTAHVALDACADAGRRAGARATGLTTQRRALRAVGVTGRRPGLATAAADPLGYTRGLRTAAEEATLLDPASLGGFTWLAQTVEIGLPPSLAFAAPT